MKFETKCEIGSFAVGISDNAAYKIISCDTCVGIGKVTIGAEEFVCPKCRGKAAHPFYAGRKWFIATSGKVGQITIEATSRDYKSYMRDDEKEVNVKYMLTSTGVGSGQVWEDENIFHSREAAQEECDKRNLVSLDMSGEVKEQPALMD